MTLLDPETASFPYQLIIDHKALPDLLAQWSKASHLAIDTEFIRTNTFLAKPGLIQIADQHGVYLLDPLAIGDLSGLVPILENPDIIKVMHAMSEDVDLLFHSLGARINRVFDTQIAAAFAGIGASLGYQNLVMQVLAVPLDKGETRSDWLQRPLSDSQLAYAAMDVVYLMKLYDVLKPKLESLGYLSALYEETYFLTEQTYRAWDQPDQAYLKLRGGWDLPESSQQLLQALVIWRDKTAFSENIPRPWVFDDASLIEMARLHPQTVYEIKRIRTVSGRSCKQFADSVLAVISGFEPDLDSERFQLIDAPLKPTEMPLYKKLKSVVNEVSRQTNIPLQLLGSRKMLEMVVMNFTRKRQSEMPSNILVDNQAQQKLSAESLNDTLLPEEFRGWRYSLFARRFLDVLRLVT